MELETLEIGIGNDNLINDETMENGNNGKCNWKLHFEFGIRNWQWKHWKFVYKT